ncbi:MULTISPECIES: hypothetical protein [unclassified Rhizobium]|jgi:hypothetical protein|uniref:hypothetical protein n=1 Tax=unclassified Rhizobium TaxID=2613769 RepID=UPI003805C162
MASSVFTITKQAHRDGIEAQAGKNVLMPVWPARLMQAASGYFSRRWNRLDLEETPNSVKRDLGFLDGHAPYREEDQMR